MDSVFNAVRDTYNSAHNAVLKETMTMLNHAELFGFGMIQKSIDVPVVRMTEDENRHLQWQYASQGRVQETPARIIEYLQSPVGPETIALTAMLKAFNPLGLAPAAHTLERGQVPSGRAPNGEDKWQTPEQEATDWVPQLLNDLPPSREQLHGHEVQSFHGLEWLFLARLGCYFLRPWTDPTTGRAGLCATFDQLTRYALKPGMLEPRILGIYFHSHTGTCGKPNVRLPRPNLRRVKRNGHWTSRHCHRAMDRHDSDGDDSDNDDSSPMFDEVKDRRELHVAHIVYGDICIESEQHPLFPSACRALMMMALCDSSIRYHAILSHMLTGDVFTCATVRALPLSHPLRPLLQPLMHRVFEMNNAYRLIVPEHNGTLHVLFPYSWEGLSAYMRDLYAGYSIMADSWEPWASGTAMLRQPEAKHSLLPAVGIVQDMHDLFDMFVAYVSDYLQAVDITSDACVKADDALVEWVNQIKLQQPNDTSRAELECEFTTRPLVTLRRLLVMYFFHSCVTHKTSSTTERLVASNFAVPTQLFADVDADGKPELPGVQTARRAMIGANATSMVVPLLNQPWGDLMLPDTTDCDKMARAKATLNSLQYRLTTLERDMRKQNRKRYFPSEGMFPTELPCSIST